MEMGDGHALLDIIWCSVDMLQDLDAEHCPTPPASVRKQTSSPSASCRDAYFLANRLGEDVRRAASWGLNVCIVFWCSKREYMPFSW